MKNSRNTPNGKIGEIIVEVDDKYILNVNSRVGVQKDFNNFIDDVVLIDEFGGRHFYLETIFRGKDTFFDMGTIINGKLTFDIHPRFAQVNDTYNAVWNFNLANFIDGFLSNTQSLSKIIDEDIDLGDFTNITVSTFDLTLIEDLTTVDSFGYMMSVNIPEDVISLIESDIDPELVDPGNGGTIGDSHQLGTLGAYKLMQSSPLIDGGLNIKTEFGFDVGPQDYFGTPVPVNEKFDVGAAEYK